MKILMILANPFTHDPRVYNEAISLIKKGHKVTVLAWDKRKENPSLETKDGIEIIRSYNSKFMSFLPYDIFRLHFWWYKGYKDALELQKKKHFDVIHCHDLDTLPVGVKLKKKLGIPLVYDAHEIWGYMISRDLPKIWANLYLFLEKGLIKNVDEIITVNEPLEDYFKSITNKPITIIMNCKPLQGTKYEPTKNNVFRIIYIGTLEKPRFLLELIDVVKVISNLECIIAGGGNSKYIEALKNKCKKTQNVKYIGKIPMDQVLPMTKKADVIICMTSPDDPNNSRALANKQFEAMVSGRPVICTKGTYPGEFTLKNKCGLSADFNKQSLKEAIVELRDKPKLCEELGKNALKAAIEKYNWKKQEEKLKRAYEKIKR